MNLLNVSIRKGHIYNMTSQIPSSVISVNLCQSNLHFPCKFIKTHDSESRGHKEAATTE